MRIFLTSDWHFCHDREFIWGVRGFSSVQEMNEEIVRKHNELVNPEDTVYVLGDCGLGGGTPQAKENLKSLIERLNGELIFINGNHDTDQRIELYKQCKNCKMAGLDALRIRYGKYHFFLSHYPIITYNHDKGPKKALLNIYGHTHQKDKFMENSWANYCVCVDAHNCYPALLDNIIEEIEMKYKEGDVKC